MIKAPQPMSIAAPAPASFGAQAPHISEPCRVTDFSNPFNAIAQVIDDRNTNAMPNTQTEGARMGLEEILAHLKEARAGFTTFNEQRPIRPSEDGVRWELGRRYDAAEAIETAIGRIGDVMTMLSEA